MQSCEEQKSAAGSAGGELVSEAAMDEQARLARIKELRDEILASPDRKLVIEYELVAKTYGVFKGNARELRVYLDRHSDPAIALPLWDLNHRERLYAFLDEVGRLLHNYLAAVGSLREHTRILWQTYLAEDPAYTEQVQSTFAESGCCLFVQDLRNYTLHSQLPVAHAHMSGTQTSVDFTVRLSRPDLLRWSGWRSKAKEYLRGLPADEIDLAEVIGEYGKTVTEFYDWFGFAFRERTLNPFRRIQRLYEAHNEALADVDASRASRPPSVGQNSSQE
jgi:hypothetical protein